jgi:hypothetical protein
MSPALSTAPKPASCFECGKVVAPILASLGSLTCHDCRKPANVVLRPLAAG